MLIILHYSLWFLITHYCSSLLTIIHYCSLISRIIYYVYYHSLSFIIVPSWWFTIHHYSLLFTIIHYCSHYSSSLFIFHQVMLGIAPSRTFGITKTCTGAYNVGHVFFGCALRELVGHGGTPEAASVVSANVLTHVWVIPLEHAV